MKPDDDPAAGEQERAAHACDGPKTHSIHSTAPYAAAGGHSCGKAGDRASILADELYLG
jgi:hypothetical protein